jgi:hypothetical protein
MGLLEIASNGGLTDLLPFVHLQETYNENVMNHVPPNGSGMCTSIISEPDCRMFLPMIITSQR